MAEDAYVVLKQLGVSSAHIVGFSDGAILGLLLARDYPDAVASLVSIGANLELPNVYCPQYFHIARSYHLTCQAQDLLR